MARPVDRPMAAGKRNNPTISKDGDRVVSIVLPVDYIY